jgi:APA family basic amino acid/polyamine antiporter
VVLKVIVVIMFIVLGWDYIDPQILHISLKTLVLKVNLVGSGIAAERNRLLAFIGFDAVSTAAQVKTLKKGCQLNFSSLVICTIHICVVCTL